MKIVYNKLVRDRIPEIIRAQGKQCTTRVLEQEAYIAMLDAKLTEELAEYQADRSLEELADLAEVLYAVAEARGYSREALEQVRLDKAQKRGGFRQRILLESVEE